MHLRTGPFWGAAHKVIGKKHPMGGPERIGLALGGGFARGIAHVGVLRVFERNQIPIHSIAGVSSGAIVAAAYACGCTVDHIEAVARSMRFRDVARWTMTTQDAMTSVPNHGSANPPRHVMRDFLESLLGFAGSDPMVSFLKRLLQEDRFENMKLPLAIVATDLATGKPFVFRDTGDVVLPIRASCSYPGLFLPIRYEGRYLVDGVVGMEVPAKPLLDMGATRIISVHLPMAASSGEPINMFSVVNRCFQIMSGRLQHEWREYSDLVISPAVSNLGWDSFEDATRLIDLGAKAAEGALPKIERWLKHNSATMFQPGENLGVALQSNR